MQKVKCVGRTDITLSGSFADLVLVPATDEMEGVHSSSPIILTNPGQLHFYDEDCLSALSHQERRGTVSPLPYEMVIPTVDPQMTVSKLGFVPKDEKFLEPLSEVLLIFLSHLFHPRAHTPTTTTPASPETRLPKIL